MLSIGVIALVIYKLKPKKQLTEKEKQDISGEFNREWTRVRSQLANQKHSAQDIRHRVAYTNMVMQEVNKKHPEQFLEKVWLPFVNEFLGKMGRLETEDGNGIKELTETDYAFKQTIIRKAKKLEKNKGHIPQQHATL